MSVMYGMCVFTMPGVGSFCVASSSSCITPHAQSTQRRHLKAILRCDSSLLERSMETLSAVCFFQNGADLKHRTKHSSHALFGDFI